MSCNLIIGFGNYDRRDDGVAFYVINAVRQWLGQKPLDEEELDEHLYGRGTDSLFVRQLVPELTIVAQVCQRLIFVDAHVPQDNEKIKHARIFPQMVSAAFTHTMQPESFLWLLKTLCSHEPQAYILSIQGHDFDFGRGLSPDTAMLVDPAIRVILELLEIPSVTGRRQSKASPIAV